MNHVCELSFCIALQPGCRSCRWALVARRFKCAHTCLVHGLEIPQWLSCRENSSCDYVTGGFELQRLGCVMGTRQRFLGPLEVWGWLFLFMSEDDPSPRPTQHNLCTRLADPTCVPRSTARVARTPSMCTRPSKAMLLWRHPTHLHELGMQGNHINIILTLTSLMHPYINIISLMHPYTNINKSYA